MKELQLRKEIYSAQSVLDAVATYSGYARISVIEEAKYIQVSFTDCKYDETRTVKEFENYLIGLENI